MKDGSGVKMGIGVAARAAAAAAVVVLCGSPPARTDAPRQDAAAPAVAESRAPAAREMTAADVGAFLDGLLPTQIERDDIAGAVVAIVKDGKLLFAKGYGDADLEKKVPVSPETTLFRPGSVSKLFTWTAVMQQVEEGKLDLDRDVNEYLDFKIPATYREPITLRHILTHTAGFEEAAKNLFVREASELQPLRDYLVARLPGRIFPPGTTPAYSNYAATLAGYVVQRASGMRFEDYVAERIFKPLGMTRSTFVQPPPEALAPLLSSGYRLASKGSKPFEFVQSIPAGSLSATALDMSRFMLAHLQEGQLEGQRILQLETARLMHSRQFGLHPDMNGMAFGFYEESRNGLRIIGHAGDTAFFHSDLHLILEAGVGFFVSYNSAGSAPVPPRGVLFEKFMDRYFPYTPPPAPEASGAEDVRAVAGSYLISRRPETTLLKALGALSQVVVSPNADGTIGLDLLKDASGQVKRWRRVGPSVFREAEGQDRLAFQRTGSGRMQLLIPYPFMVFERVGWLDSKRVNLPLLLGPTALFAITLLLWPVAALVRRHYGRKLELGPGEGRRRLAVRLFAAANVAFVAGWLGLGLQLGLGDSAAFGNHQDPWLRLLQVVGILGVAGTAVAVYHAYRSWRQPGRGLGTRLLDTAVAVAFAAFGFFLLRWNMLDWSLKY